MSLRNQTFSAVRWTTTAMVGRATLQLVQVAILARMLAPADFGLMAIVIAVMAFLQVFADLGVSTALIHYQDIPQAQLSSLYWLNVAAGAGLMLVLMATSVVISDSLFNQPALQPILMLISMNILFLALGQQVRVMAEKALRFSVLAKVEVSAAMAGFITAITWAWLAPSVYALVAGVLVHGFTLTTMLWLFASQGWRPAFRMQLDGIGRFLRFGGYMMANNFVNSFNQQADILIGGRVFSASSLGLYSLPRNLNLSIIGAINPIVTRVGLPVMARAQHDKTFLKSVYLQTMRMTASISFPIYLALAVFSRESVTLVFGEKWIDSAPLLVFLAIWGMLRACGNPVGSLLLAVGKADLSFKFNLALLFVVFPVLWFASTFGVLGLAVGQAALMLVLLVPGWYFLVWPNCGASLSEYVMNLLRPLFAAASAVAAGFLGVSMADTLLNTPFLRLFGAGLLAIPVYVAVSWAVNREWVLAMGQLVFGRRQQW